MKPKPLMIFLRNWKQSKLIYIKRCNWVIYQSYYRHNECPPRSYQYYEPLINNSRMKGFDVLSMVKSSGNLYFLAVQPETRCADRDRTEEYKIAPQWARRRPQHSRMPSLTSDWSEQRINAMECFVSSISVKSPRKPKKMRLLFIAIIFQSIDFVKQHQNYTLWKCY